VHGKLTALSSCICPGYETVIFECVVTGSGATIWNGTALDHCSIEKITLRHSEFNQPGYNISHTCGDNGQVIGRAVSVVNGSYTSQLLVNVSQGLNSADVECARQTLSNGVLHIGTEQILLTTGLSILNLLIVLFIGTYDIIKIIAPLPSPSNVTLSQINSSRLTFTWNSVSPDCQAVHYEITVTNCGQCPNTTSCGVICPISADTNSVSCIINENILSATDLDLLETCVIMIQPVVCGIIISGDSFIFNVSAH
jgi:hypothetical protein